MDSGGGPGPPRPADSSAAHLPSSHDGNLNLFPFNASVAQHPTQLGVRIPSNRAAPNPSPRTSTPFSNLPFIPGVPQPNPSVPIAPNNPPRINPQTNMLQQINAAATAANESGAMQTGNLPQNVQQPSPHDFFGAFEKAFASKPGQPSAAKGADVIDSTPSMAMPGHPSSQQQPSGIVGAQTRPQLQQAHLRQQRIQHHLQLQEQLQQQLQQQQQQQQQQQLQHPSALQQSLLSRQQQQMHPYLQQPQIAPGQFNAGMHALGTNLRGQNALPPGQMPQQPLTSGLHSQLTGGDRKTGGKQQTRRPRAGSGGNVPIVPGSQVPNTLAAPSLAPAHNRQQIPMLPGQLAFSARQGQFQQTPLQLQPNPAALRGGLAQQPSVSNHAAGGAQSSIGPGSFPSNHVNSMLGAATPHQQTSAGNNALSGFRNLAGGHVSSRKVQQQRVPQGNPEMAKFDAATLQRALRSTNDPKIEAAIKQQLEYLRYKAAMSASPQNVQGQPTQRQLGSAVGSNAQRLGSLPQSGVMASQNASQVPQAAILQRQQILQKQQLLRQQQQLQQQQLQHQQLQLRSHISLPHGQQASASSFPSQGLPGSHPSGAISHSTQEASALTNRLRNQALGQQHPQSNRRTQHSQSSHSQSASQGTPSDLAGEGQQSSSQNSQRKPSTRRPRRSARVAKNEAENANGVSGIGTDLSVHQGRITRSRVLTAQGADSQIQVDRLSRLHPSQMRKSGAQGTVPPSLTRSTAEAVEQAAQAAQLAAVRAARVSSLAVDDKRAVEDRKRMARETELSNIAEQKKRRLQAAPWNDYQRILAPDYTTPFSNVADAWERLVPYHVVLTDEDASVPQEEWDSEIDKLSKKYRDCFRSLRESFDRLFDAGFESMGSDAELPGYSSLCKEDSLILDSILLRDYYETARKQALIAQEKESRRAAELERQRVAEINRQRSMAQREELMARNAARASATQVSLPRSLPSTSSHAQLVSSGLAASGALPPPAGPGLLPTLSQRSEGLPAASGLPGVLGPNAKGVPAFSGQAGSPYDQRLGSLRPGPPTSMSAAGLQMQTNFGARGSADHLQGRQSTISAPVGVAQAPNTGSGPTAQGSLNTSLHTYLKNQANMPLAGGAVQGYAQSTGTARESAGVTNEAKAASIVPNPAMYHSAPHNGPLSMDLQNASAKASASDGLPWTEARASHHSQPTATLARTVAGARNEVVRNGMQQSRQGVLPGSNVRTEVGGSVAPVAHGMEATGTSGMGTAGKPPGVTTKTPALNGSHHEALKPTLPQFPNAGSGLVGSQNMGNFGKSVDGGASTALPNRSVGNVDTIGGGQLRMQRNESGTSVGLGGNVMTHGVLPSLPNIPSMSRDAGDAGDKGSAGGVVDVDGSLGAMGNKANDAGRQAGKGGEFGGLGMGSLLNADGS